MYHDLGATKPRHYLLYAKIVIQEIGQNFRLILKRAIFYRSLSSSRMTRIGLEPVDNRAMV